MDLNEYQAEALRTASNGASSSQLHIAALGLCGESGEFADLIKKHLEQGHPLDREKLKKELGDVFWYLAFGAACIGMTLDEIAEANKAKLRKRYPDGFSVERSVNRPVE